MNKHQISLLFSFSIVLQLFFVTSHAQHQSDLKWEKNKYEKGMILKNFKGELFGSPQNINVLEVNLKKRRLSMVYDSSENILTSEHATNTGSLAAVNAGFFNMKTGGANSYIKVDGTSYDQQLSKSNHLNGVLIFTNDNTVEIEPFSYTPDSYADNQEYDDVLAVGPVLIDAGIRQAMDTTSFYTKRHPRTCLCIVNDAQVKLITVDGRNKDAAGMSLNELTDLTQMLNCNEVINLDGGGSTTMWIKSVGVTNMPSDNKKFDHQGERPVANIIAVY